MSGPYGQPGYNPQYQNPYPAGGPPPPGWNAQGGQQQGIFDFRMFARNFYYRKFPYFSLIHSVTVID
ncbi:hypothetical protein Aduo_015284 [Ancylostoma duodenale]